MTEPGGEMAAGAAGGGRLRASDADREQVIDVLKVAFVQTRLTKDEFDARVGQAFASRTYTELAAVTAGIPSAPTRAQPPCHPVRPGAWQPVNPDLKGDVRVLVTAYPIAVVSWLAAVLLSDNPASMFLPLFAFIATVAALHSSLHGAMVLAEPQLQKRFGWQLLPPSPEPGEWLSGVKTGTTGITSANDLFVWTGPATGKAEENALILATRPGAWSSSTCTYARPAVASEWTAAPGDCRTFKATDSAGLRRPSDG